MRKLFNGYYKDKTVLVTGHTGFKGSWLSIWLKELGANVIGYSQDPVSEKDNFVVTDLANKLIDIRGDILDQEKLQSVFRKYQPEVVFHLAAQPLVRLSYDIPRQTFEENVMGTINVLEMVRAYDSVKTAIMITSDKSYENKEWLWGYRENDPMGGYDPYSASKGCAELVISSYINSFFNPNQYKDHHKAVASVRAGNVIGGGDWARDRIIPDCIRALEKDEPICVRNPQAVRPWQHVMEPLSGYLWLGAQIHRHPSKFSGGWNFGPNLEAIITVEQMVEMLIEKYGTGSWKNISDSSQPHEAKLLSLDYSKSYFQLGWKPTFTIDQCLETTAEWYKRYNYEDSYNLCVEQIETYSVQAMATKLAWAV